MGPTFFGILDLLIVETSDCLQSLIFVSHLPRIFVHFSLLASHNSGASVGLAAGAGVGAATGDGGGWRWCGGGYRGRCRGGG